MSNLSSLLANPIIVTLAIPFTTAFLALAALRPKYMPGLIAIAATVAGLVAVSDLAFRAFASPLSASLAARSWSLHFTGQNSFSAWQMNFLFRADALATTMLVVLGLLFFVAAIYSQDHASSQDLRSYYFFLLLAYAGANGTVLAGDLMTLYVSWEITTLACAALILRPLRAPNVMAAKIFVATSLTTSIPMFFGIIWLLTRIGTVDLQQLRAIQPTADFGPGGLIAVALLLAFAVRTGVVPLHVWLTQATEAVFAPVSIVLGSVLTALGSYTIIRIVLPSFTLSYEWMLAIAVIGALSSILGPIGALRSFNYKTALAYLAIGQMGLVLLPLGAATSMGEAAALFQIIGFCAYFPLFFLGIAQAYRLSASGRRWPQVVQASPTTFIALIVGMLGLAGVPPFAGYAPRTLVFQALLDARTSTTVLLLVASVLATSLTAAAALNLFIRTITSQVEPRESGKFTNAGARIAITILVTLTLGLGLVAEALMRNLIQPLVATLTGVSVSSVALLSDTWIVAVSAFALAIAVFLGAAIYLHQRGMLENQSNPYSRSIRTLAWPAGILAPVYQTLAFLLQSNILDVTAYCAVVLNVIAKIANGVVYVVATRHAPDPDAHWDYQEDEGQRLEETEAA